MLAIIDPMDIDLSRLSYREQKIFELGYRQGHSEAMVALMAKYADEISLARAGRPIIITMPVLDWKKETKDD